MESRRKFLKLMAWFAMSVNLLLNPCLSFVRTVYSKTRIITMYIEGTNEGSRFRRALEKASKKKIMILLKGTG